MLDEEHELLRKMVSEFAEKEIEPLTLKIEREGVTKEVINKMVLQGFMGAIAPAEYQGPALDQLGYCLLLEELARRSPSLAFYTLIQNSFVIAPLLKYGSNSQKQKISAIAKGELNGALVYSEILASMNPGEISVNKNLTGTRNHVINSDSNLYLLNVKKDNKNRLVLIESGANPLDEHIKLGFRGLRFSPVRFNSEISDSNFLSDQDGLKMIEETLNNAALGIAAIAVGIGEASLLKAMDYSKVRFAFSNPLANFQPLAFAMTESYAELQSLKHHLFSIAAGEWNLKEALMIKLLSLEFAKKTAKLALQVHGGYGYLEDFGIEKFYRDSMALAVLTQNSVNEKVLLSNLIFEASVANL